MDFLAQLHIRDIVQAWREGRSRIPGSTLGAGALIGALRIPT